jgi:hypothetical protein
VFSPTAVGRKFLQAGRFLSPSTFQVFVFLLLMTPHLTPVLYLQVETGWQGEQTLGRQ